MLYRVDFRPDKRTRGKGRVTWNEGEGDVSPSPTHKEQNK